MQKKTDGAASKAKSIVRHAVNDNLPTVRVKVRQWALHQKHLTPLKKAFLMVGANLVDEQGECFLLNDYFRGYLNISRRCVQNYLRALERDRLIELTGTYMKRNGSQVPLYRFAPDDDEVNALRLQGARLAAHVRVVERTSVRVQMKEVEEKDGSIEPSESGDRFEEVCDRYPQLGLQRTNFAEARRLWRLHSEEIGADRLFDAVAVYSAAPERQSDGFVPGLDGWLRKERYRGYLRNSQSIAPGSPRLPEGNVPNWLQSEFLGSFAETWVRAWLVPCIWDAETSTLLPRTNVAGDRLMREGKFLLDQHGVTVLRRLASNG